MKSAVTLNHCTSMSLSNLKKEHSSESSSKQQGTTKIIGYSLIYLRIKQRLNNNEQISNWCIHVFFAMRHFCFIFICSFMVRAFLLRYRTNQSIVENRPSLFGPVTQQRYTLRCRTSMIWISCASSNLHEKLMGLQGFTFSGSR